MSQNWINAQAESNVKQFDALMDIYNRDATSFLNDHEKYYQRVCVDCNYLDAVKMLNWDDYLKDNCIILDMGSGGGWLSGFLSSFASVKKIYALDSSKFFLHKMMPKILERMHANSKKITTVEGLFTPILFESGSLDIVVVSSALHHADNLEETLKEIRRVLKKDGVLFILNETPGAAFRHLLRVFKASILIFKQLLFKTYQSISPTISSSGYLYDPNLGDKAYPLWYWEKALNVSGFTNIQVFDTKLSTLKGLRGQSLFHFICK
jgi:SAM-dependent methyltransferase